MKHIIKWTIHPSRKDKRTGWVSPVKPSEYYYHLMEVTSRRYENARITDNENNFQESGS